MTWPLRGTNHLARNLPCGENALTVAGLSSHPLGTWLLLCHLAWRGEGPVCKRSPHTQCPSRNMTFLVLLKVVEMLNSPLREYMSTCMCIQEQNLQLKPFFTWLNASFQSMGCVCLQNGDVSLLNQVWALIQCEACGRSRLGYCKQ